MLQIKRNSVHHINFLPQIEELDKLISFCDQFKYIYVHAYNSASTYIVKYIDMCGVKNLNGIVKFEDGIIEKLKKILTNNLTDITFSNYKVINYSEIKNYENTGIILPYKFNNNILTKKYNKFKKDNFYVLSKYVSQAIATQVCPREKHQMTFEINLVDHCNLSCQMCDHFSQLSEKWFVNVEDYNRDMSRMGELFDHQIGAITLLGGEPTLHPELDNIIKITRREFPKSEIILLTNGVLLNKLENSENYNLWEVLKKYDIHVTVTVYPVKIDYLLIEKKAKDYGILLKMSSDIHANKLTKQIKISDKHTMNMDGNVPKHHCINCLYFNKFNVLKDGKFFMCPIQAHIDIFNKRFGTNLEHTSDDYLDIYKVNSWKEFAEFSSRCIPFCRYCDLKKWGHASEWKPSSKNIEEYI